MTEAFSAVSEPLLPGCSRQLYTGLLDFCQLYSPSGVAGALLWIRKNYPETGRSPACCYDAVDAVQAIWLGCTSAVCDWTAHGIFVLVVNKISFL